MNRKVAREIVKLIYELEFHSEAEDEASNGAYQEKLFIDLR